MLLEEQRILLGVTGGIAAYKACELARMLMREGADVQAVLTPNAARFVTPLTFAALTGNPAPVNEFTHSAGETTDEIFQHLSLSSGIDCYVITPATANTLGKLAAGITGNLVCGAYLSCQAPVVIAPAMNTRMWEHAAVQANVKALLERGNIIIEPATGEMACGDTGAGRLAELPEIFAAVVTACNSVASPLTGDLHNKRIIVTAGGTREYLDPVRFITNASSGVLGLSIASELSNRGARVTLVDTGISVDSIARSQLAERLITRTASEMQSELAHRMPSVDALIMLAAVADYRPAKQDATKHKKDGAGWNVRLCETEDILTGIAAQRKPGQVLVGVSLEDTDWLDRGMKKASAKHVDLNIAVDMQNDMPFGECMMHCALVDEDSIIAQPEMRDKGTVARLLADWLAAKFKNNTDNTEQ